MKRFFTIFGLLALIGWSGVLNAQIPTSGLIAKYSFSGNTNDESGNNLNATAINGPTLTQDRFGNANNAYYFDGNNDYITAEIGTYQAMTVSLWVKAEYPVQWYPVVCEYSQYTEFIHFMGNHPAYVSGGSVGSIYTGYMPGTPGILGVTQLNYVDWYHIVAVFEHSTNTFQFYVNNALIASGTTTGVLAPLDGFIRFGNTTTGTQSDGGAGYIGKLDDIRIYNRSLNNTEIGQLFSEGLCSDIVVSDTLTFYVANSEFQTQSPKTYLETIDSLTTLIGSCDSIIYHYSEYIYYPNFCTDTIEVYDTTYVTINDTVLVSVTDTLIIDAVLTGITPPNNINTLKIYPNPASTHIYINNGDYSLMNGYTITIENSLSQVVFTSLINQAEFYVDLSTWTGNGLYIVKIIDNSSNVIETKRIIIQ